MSCIEELIKIANEVEIQYCILEGAVAKQYISSVYEVFSPERTRGHLSIGSDSLNISTDKYEFEFSHFWDGMSCFVFFEQKGDDINKVFVLKDNKKLSQMMEKSFGMEYFVSDKAVSYLIAVNWYCIEYVGSSSFVDYFREPCQRS